MYNNRIGDVLKAYRKKKHLSIQDVGLLLKERYDLKVCDATVYNWESNQHHPTSDMLLILCDLYDIHRFDAFSESGETKSDFVMSPKEKFLIEQFRQHPEAHEEIFKLLDME